MMHKEMPFGVLIQHLDQLPSGAGVEPPGPLSFSTKSRVRRKILSRKCVKRAVEKSRVFTSENLRNRKKCKNPRNRPHTGSVVLHGSRRDPPAHNL